MTVPQLPRQRREMREGVAKLEPVRPFIFITASFFCVCVCLIKLIWVWLLPLVSLN